MTVGPMQFGTSNNAGTDTTVLQALPLSTAPGAQRGVTLGVLANDPPGATDATEAVAGHSFGPFGAGVVGRAMGFNGMGVVGTSHSARFSIGVYGLSRTGFAGRFIGTVFKTGGGFMIDHPTDAENRYLCHSFVESPEMLNIYSGNIETNDQGEAIVGLPDYFEDLNSDFTYNLTVIGQFAQAIVAEEVRENAFTIRTDQPNVRVSWQVTGVRKDHWAEANRIVVEQDKPEEERGKYLHPEAFEKPESLGVGYGQESTLGRQEVGEGAERSSE
jgi:hypothetical protein